MLRSLLCAFAALGIALTAHAQIGLSGPKITYTATPEASGVAPGSPLRALFAFSLEEHWHVNANKPLEDFLIPTTLTLEPAEGLALTKVVYPAHSLFKTKFQEQPLAVYEAQFTIGAVFDVAADATPGPRTLKGTLTYQACNDTQCSPPKDLPIELTLTVLAAGEAPTPSPDASKFSGLNWNTTESVAAPDSTPTPEPAPAPTPTLSGDWKTLLADFQIQGETQYVSTPEFLTFIDNAQRGVAQRNLLEGQGFWGILLAVLLGGFLLNLTPCVLPLIPINLAIIGAGARAGSKARGALLGSAYGLGIALTYGALGLTVVLGLSNAFGAINATVWFNTAIALLFLLLGLAMFDLLQIDFSRLQARFGIRKNERGSPGVAFAMGALSALLAGACVAPMLIATLLYAQDQYARGNILALALPFLLGVGMALPWPFAGAGLSFLPKPGGWMDWVKKGLGLFILLLGLYYLKTAYGIYQERNVDPAAVTASAKDAEAHGWLTNLEQGLQQAKAENKPVLIDFWATWCKNCLIMNETTLKDPAVLQRLEGFIKIKYQAENPNLSPTKDIWEHFKLVGLPTYIILKPN